MVYVLLYKVTLDYLCPFLCRLFNEIFDKGETPECFCEGIISLIHKSGPTDDPGIFRGICLINILCKMFYGYYEQMITKLV